MRRCSFSYCAASGSQAITATATVAPLPISIPAESHRNTPVVRLNRFRDHLAREPWVKAESFNPGGSVKDRPATNMIENAERRGLLQPGATLVEPTSGNIGIGLAMVAAVKGHRAVFIMAADMSEERKALMRAFGGELVLTPAALGTQGAVAEAHGCCRLFMLAQK